MCAVFTVLHAGLIDVQARDIYPSALSNRVTDSSEELLLFVHMWKQCLWLVASSGSLSLQAIANHYSASQNKTPAKGRGSESSAGV